MRVEPTPNPASSSKGHPVLRGISKIFFLLVRLPFKITFRFLFIVFLVVLFVIVLRTGIWHVPVVSDIVYRMPTPLHAVQPSPYSTKLLALQASESLVGASGNASMILDEGLITYMVRDMFATERIQDVVVSITPDFLEVYGVIPRTHPVVIRAQVLPSVNDGKISYDIQSIHVGLVRVPQALISSTLISWLTPPLFDSLVEHVRVQDLTLQQSALTLQFHSL